MSDALKIAKVDVVPYGIPIKGFADAYTSFSTSNAVLVRITANDGTVGYGEACAWEPEFYGETLESIVVAIGRYVAPKIIGLNPLDIGHVLSVVDALLARVTCVKEGIDLALHDLVGRVLDVPVYTLLDGSYRDRIPVASEVGIDTPEGMARKALDLLELGIGTLKVKGSSDWVEDVKRVRAVREAVGPDIALRLDPNAHWTAIGALRAMKELEDCRLEYLEQPVPSSDLNGMERVRKSIGVPLMADESIWTPEDVVELARRGAADIINIKISKTCGLMVAKRVEAVADALGMQCVVGTEIEPGFSLAAKLHLAASLRNLTLACEFTEMSLLTDSILRPKVALEDGCLRVPQGPGLGFTPDEGTLEKYTIALYM
jgi:L-alanine-DL-glutamate epimerase-like enolase superfamily enzyme